MLRPDECFNVLVYDMNRGKIKKYNILQDLKDYLKQLRKDSTNKEEFIEHLDSELQYRYWARGEFELVLERIGEDLYIRPWVGYIDFEESRILGEDDEVLDWEQFSTYKKLSWWGNESRFNVYDQLKFRWEEFTNTCWNLASDIELD